MRAARAPGVPPGARAAAFAAIAAFYLAIPNARPDFTRFNCHDSESYLALAYNLAHGRGYTRSLIADAYIPHTTWPPGVPLLMAPAMAIGGETVDWVAVKSTAALVGLAGLAAVWLYVRRLTSSAAAADLGALLVALNPFYWDFSHQAMAELPLTVWLIGGLLLVDLTWAGRRPGPLGAATVGAICGLGMMLKGHAGGLLLAPLAYRWGPRRSVAGLGPFLTSWAAYGTGFVLPQAAWMARNRAVPATGFEGINRFRSVLAVSPNDASSGMMGLDQVIGSFLANAKVHGIYRLPAQVVPGLWSPSVFDWGGSGSLGLILSVAILGLAVARRRSLPTCLVAAPIAILNLLYPLGGSARFWVPISMLMTIAIVLNLGPELSRLRAGPRGVWLATAAVALAANLAFYVAGHERQPYNPEGSWRELATLFERVAEEDIRPGRVFTPNPLAFRLMTGREAPWGSTDCRYESLIFRSDGLGPQPPGPCEVRLRVGPWCLASLARSLTYEDLRNRPEKNLGPVYIPY